MSRLAENLRTMRGAESQKSFAKSLGVKQQTYANYELGLREPDLDTLVRISRVVGKSVDDLLGVKLPPPFDRNADKVADLKRAIITILKEY